MLNKNFELINLLNIKTEDNIDTIKQKYYTKLRSYYATLHKKESEESYKNAQTQIIKLTKLFTEYFCNQTNVMDIKEDAFAVTTINEKCICRCGSKYDANMLGIEECEYCSCYIYVKEAPEQLEKLS
ncbi:hypothetical protein EHP00_1454 [Ecytonucleospora hepatopenaei]|uniref:Uncharacterized protein n=1 Tax=Ecytonucleospora hepatopenaei TaxID=646526 RepID=A0A1W0E4L6_9MICR|nr:hypothetical protein EHP00_1454 [Ecytonucleospora hepatopenaei]